MPETRVTVPPCPFRRAGHRWLLDRERSTTSCQADVCEACGMLRLTSFRTGQPSYEPGDEVSFGRCSTTATATAGRLLTTVRGSGRRAG